MTSEVLAQNDTTITVLPNDNGVAMVEFSGGKKANPFSGTRTRELTRILAELDERDDIRAVILYGGDDRWFAAGGDFAKLQALDGGDAVSDLMETFGQLFLTALGMRMPVIAAIDGWAIGLGLEIALTADYRIASTSARLKMPELQLGAAVTFGGYMLTHVVGRSAMQAMIFSGDVWDAHRAVQTGLVHEVVPAERLREHAEQLAARMASWDPVPVRQTKPSLNASYLEGMREIIEISKRAHRASLGAGTWQRNMQAFLQRK
ncbi:enoyl-CoA hydratase/isomerase family protein [Amycolatopsis sp. 3B14]|uniref:enoyl-CoA hydratase/isomerase family protein n=1 Tax=Amycolatopsis sp. 3B14 TaxID=3243600 RepID=UPI003D9A0A7F